MGRKKLQEGDLDDIGTIELQICVLRSFGEEHVLCDVPAYYDVKCDGQDLDSPAGYYKIAPQHMMKFEENCVTLDNRQANKAKRAMNSKRPGAEPWAIFRFHYRSEGMSALFCYVLRLTDHSPRVHP